MGGYSCNCEKENLLYKLGKWHFLDLSSIIYHSNPRRQATAATVGAIRKRRSTQTRSSTQPGFGFQQQPIPNMRPGGAPLPNNFAPMVQQGQQGQHPGGRHAGPVSVQHGQQLLMHQQTLPRGHAYRYPPGSVIAGNMLSVPHDIVGMPLHDRGIPSTLPIEILLTALPHASPATRRTMLGEWVYPLVQQQEPEAAAKITGMIVDLDQSLVLHLLESPEAMRAMVAKAMEVLRDAFPEQYGNPADQLPSLSKSDGI